MPRKKGGGRKKSRRIEVNVSKISIPEGTTRRQYFQTLKRGLREGVLPEDWEIDIAWRNPDTKRGRSKDWQQGEWGEVLNNSTEGFRKVVTNVIKRFAGDDWGGRLAPEPKRKQPVKKAVAGKAKKKPSRTLPKTPKPSQAAKRSAAAKKGWETRRKNAAAKKKRGRK